MPALPFIGKREKPLGFEPLARGSLFSANSLLYLQSGLEIMPIPCVRTEPKFTNFLPSQGFQKHLIPATPFSFHFHILFLSFIRAINKTALPFVRPSR